MIAGWMIASSAFALLLGIAAVAVERAFRTVGRQGRGAWLFALVGAIGWPALGPAAASFLAAFSRNVVLLSPPKAGSSVAAIAAALPTFSRSWVTYLDLPLAGIWLIASLVLLARLAWSMRALSRLEQTAIRELVDGVPVLVTESIGPAVYGTRRSRVLVPRWLLDLDAPLRKLVLRHEQEHCFARDPQLALAVAFALVLMPWNAGVWWIARRLRLAVELDCDARVLRDANDTERYSKLLLFIAQRQSVVRLASMLAESNSHLGRRIAVMNATRPNNPRARVALFAIVAVGALGLSTRFASELTAAPTIVLARSTAPVATVALPKVEASPAAAVDVAPPASPRVVKRDTVAPAGIPASPSQPANTDIGPGDRNVQEVPGTPTPRYPDILKRAGVSGGVLVAFVVDTNGVVDPESMKVFVSSHELFTASIKAALPNMQFIPAMLNYKKVKQVVRLPIVFSILGSPLATDEGNRAVIEKLISDAASSNFVTLSAIVITAMP